MEIKFTAKDGHCPTFRHGNDMWWIEENGLLDCTFALFHKKVGVEREFSFTDKKTLLVFLCDKEEGHYDALDDDTIDYILRQRSLGSQFESYSMCLVEKTDGSRWVFHKHDLRLKEFIRPEKITGYFNSYMECLKMSKEIIEKELSAGYEQMNLFTTSVPIARGPKM